MRPYLPNVLMALSARMHCGITEFKRESDSDIHLILFDAGTYGIAEMPAAACVPKKPRARKAIINARKKFEAACGKATNSWKQLGAVVTISGVGFWEPHTQRSRPELRGATPCLGDQVHSRLPRLEPPRLRGPNRVRPFGPLCRPVRLCITVVAMSDETEAHEYRLGSPLASIIGLADATLEREDLDADVATRVRAIRDIAFDALRKAERGDRESGQPRPPA